MVRGKKKEPASPATAGAASDKEVGVGFGFTVNDEGNFVVTKLIPGECVIRLVFWGRDDDDDEEEEEDENDDDDDDDDDGDDDDGDGDDDDDDDGDGDGDDDDDPAAAAAADDDDDDDDDGDGDGDDDETLHNARRSVLTGACVVFFGRRSSSRDRQDQEG
eukprot:1305704-Rhodomonas_salina.1